MSLADSGKFEVLRNGQVEMYKRFQDIPSDITEVILFQPDVPEGPHTEEQHQEMAKWLDRLHELMAIANQNRI